MIKSVCPIQVSGALTCVLAAVCCSLGPMKQKMQLILYILLSFFGFRCVTSIKLHRNSTLWHRNHQLVFEGGATQTHQHTSTNGHLCNLCVEPPNNQKPAWNMVHGSFKVFPCSGVCFVRYLQRHTHNPYHKQWNLISCVSCLVLCSTIIYFTTCGSDSCAEQRNTTPVMVINLRASLQYFHEPMRIFCWCWCREPMPTSCTTLIS